MAWQLLAAALPAIANVASTALQKPRKDEFEPQTDYMKKYLSYLRGRSAQKEALHLAMQPQLRSIGKQGRELQQQVGYTAAKTGLAGSGIEAQMQLSAGQKTQEALTTATERAVATQAAQTARLGEKAELVTAQIGAEEQRAERAYQTAKNRWQRQMIGSAIQAGASFASAGLQQYGMNKGAHKAALAAGHIPAGTTYDQFKEMAQTGQLKGVERLGYSDVELGEMTPTEYAKYLGVRSEQISGLLMAEKYMGTEEVKRMLEEGWTVPKLSEEAKNTHGLIQSAFGSESIGNILGGLKSWQKMKGGGTSDAPTSTDAKEDLNELTDERSDATIIKAVEREKQRYADVKRAGSAKQLALYHREVEGGFEGSIEEWKASLTPENEEPEEIVVEKEPEVVAEEVEVKETEEIEEEPEPEEEVKAEAVQEVIPITKVYKNKPYEITSKIDPTKTKIFRFTGDLTNDGKYVFKSDDGKKISLTLEELNKRIKKNV